MIEGSCLCGAVRYQVEQAIGPLVNCHCQMCRKAHGATFSTLLPVERAGFRWTSGEEVVSHYESSPGKRRWFCPNCGSQLVSTRDADERSLLLRAGCIDHGWETPPVAEGWTRFKAPWHRTDEGLAQFERGFPGSPPGVDED